MEVEFEVVVVDSSGTSGGGVGDGTWHPPVSSQPVRHPHLGAGTSRYQDWWAPGEGALHALFLHLEVPPPCTHLMSWV